MHLQPVSNSSQIAAAGWGDEEMRIQFHHSGSIYAYSNVPEELFTRMMEAPSVGKFFTKEIKSHPDKYPYRKLS